MATLSEIQSNYIESFQFLLARKKRQVRQLVLLNNLQRGDQNIASTLLFTLLNRTTSSLYDDKIQVKFMPSQGITQDQLNAYNILAQSDYQEMDKAMFDYEWLWDALFFGRGYCETLQFDTKRKIMKPHVINPLVLGYDPYFEDPQEWRYYWKWLTKSKYQLQQLKKAGKIKPGIDLDRLATGIDPYLWEYKTRRDNARQGVQPPISPVANDVYQILEYFGYNEKGERTVYWTDKDQSVILMEEKLELDNMELEDGSKGSRWPIVVKESFKIPHSSLPLSIADLLEDKHRAKSVLLNLAYITAKDKANPLYWYNDNVADVAQFFSRQVDQHIRLDGMATGDGSVGPINTQEPMSPELMNFMSILQQEANDPVGTGVSLNPQSGGTDTATEAAIDQQLNDMAQSLQSKILQFGEKDFWSDWFHQYAKHAEELESKMANIVGVNGITSTEIDFNDFLTDYPPGVLVFSAKEAEYKNLVKRRDFMQILPELSQTMDPSGFKNFQKHVFMPLMIEDPSLIDVMYPKSIEEMKAEEENEMLKQDKLATVSDTDDHTTHLYIHRMVQPKTWAVWFHIQEHEEALAKQMAQQQQMAMAEQGQVQPGAQNPATSPMAAASPLKDNAKTSFSSNSNNQ